MRNKNSKIHGVGVNDYEGIVFSQGKHMYEYSLWSEMIRRCYNEKERYKRLTYNDCQVESFFHSFNNFFNFIKTLTGYNKEDLSGKRFQLDKDLLIKGNKTYSRDSVCFLPKEINSFLTKSNATRGLYPIGVCYHKRVGKFTAQFNSNGKLAHLGVYETQEEAYLVYKAAKEAKARELADKWKQDIDIKAYYALMTYSVHISD